MARPVTVRSAPGLSWAKYAGDRWEARWKARADVVVRGFTPKSVRLWIGTEPTKEEWDRIADVCTSLQQEMLVYANGGPPSLEGVAALDGTLRSLIRCYRTDPDSGFAKKRYASRVHYEHLFKKLDEEHGDKPLAEIKGRMFRRWYETWAEAGTTTIQRSYITMLRILLNYGAALLEDADCLRLATALSNMRFEGIKPRTERLTSDQVVAIRAKAHERGRGSIALAQAFQFECIFRQKDVLGEWVPIKEPGVSDVTRKGRIKWLRGIRWEEIDANMVLKHVTSKRNKEVTVDLKNAPMVLEELALKYGGPITRDMLPARGPIIIAERTGAPWNVVEFRRQWRKTATEAGVPKTVRNMDSRAGAITEASDAGAPLEFIKDAATHSDIGMTQRYSRNAEERTTVVQLARNQHRKAPKNDS